MLVDVNNNSEKKYKFDKKICINCQEELSSSLYRCLNYSCSEIMCKFCHEISKEGLCKKCNL